MPGDPFSWKILGVSASQWFQDFEVFHVISQRDTAKWGHPKMLALRHFGICGVLRIFAGVLRKFAGVLLVISNVFGGSFHFAHLNPQTLKSTLDIQLPFQKQKNKEFLRVSGVWRRELMDFSRILNLQVCSLFWSGGSNLKVSFNFECHKGMPKWCEMQSFHKFQHSLWTLPWN